MLPPIISPFISCGTIWFLLIIFNEGGSLKYVQQQAVVILGMVTVAGFFVLFLLPPHLGLLVGLVQAAVLYLAVEKICDFSRATALRITIWYFVIMFTIGLGFACL